MKKSILLTRIKTLFCRSYLSRLFGFTVAFSLILSTQLIGQNNDDLQSLELGPGSTPIEKDGETTGDLNEGPALQVVIPFLHNIPNTDDDLDFTPFFPLTTATLTIFYDGDVVGGNVSQETPDERPVLFGWNFNPGGVSSPDPGEFDIFVDGSENDIIVPFLDLDESISREDEGDGSELNIFSISDMESHFSSTINTFEDGISFDEDGDGVNGNTGAYIAAGFEGLDGFDFIGGRHLIAKMTVEFNRPIINPVMHLFGLGGLWDYVDAEGNLWINAASVEFDLLDGDVELSLLSSNCFEDNGDEICGLEVSGNQIINTFNVPDVIVTDDSGNENAGVANGSVLIESTIDGEGVTSLTLGIYARGIRDAQAAQAISGHDPDDLGTCFSDCIYYGDEIFGWAGSDDPDEPFGQYNYAHDLFIMSFSTDVDPDETQLTQGDSYRMLTSPVANTSYDDLIGELWTQGGALANGYDFDGGTPNIYRWPLGVANSWEDGFDLNETITAGHGFLMTVFEDDVFGESGSFPKTLSVIGSEPEPPITITSPSGASDGWMLLGNPFKDPIDISNLLDATTNTANSVYVWDRNVQGYLASTQLTGDGSVGEIDNGVLMPFQGFFIQKAGASATVDFGDGGELGDPDALRTITQGTFYRKEVEPNNIVRFELNGNSFTNSLWLTFANENSPDRMLNDALELSPLTSEYALMSTRKSDDVLLTIGQFPIPDEEFEIPVSVEATKAGQYTIDVTDFYLTLAHDLYFTDLEKDVSIRIDENFSYTFTMNQVAKAISSPLDALKKGPQKATTQFGDRFLITTQPREMESTMPREIALNQNYPNPFNPTTQIQYEIPQQSEVLLTVYDMSGRQVATLVNGSVQAGVHTVNFDGSSLASGVYMYRLRAGNTVLSRKLTIIK